MSFAYGTSISIIFSFIFPCHFSKESEIAMYGSLVQVQKDENDIFFLLKDILPMTISARVIKQIIFFPKS